MDAIPVIRIPKVFHLGTLDPSQLGANSGGSSQEGRCLSVSLCPNAWSEIARLGDELHELRRQDGVFLDVMAVLVDPASRRDVLEWGVREGYARVERLWRSWRYDDEAEEWRYMLCVSEREAVEEAGAYVDADYAAAADVPGPDGSPGIEPVELPVAERKLSDLTGFSGRADEDATDALAVAFAIVAVPERTGVELDGVWWREDYAPHLLSAPRGGIFPERVAGWRPRREGLERICDETELGRMPLSEPLEAGPRPRP